MNNLAVLVNNFGPGQIAYDVISNLNKMTETDEWAVYGFYETLMAPCLTTQFAVGQLFDAWSFNGPVIATSLLTLDRLRQFVGPNKKFFYAYELEWMQLKEKKWAVLRNLYTGSDLELITRSPDMAKIIEDCWQKPVKYIVEGFNYQDIARIVCG